MRFIGKQSDKIGDATKITLGSTGSSQTTDLGSKDIVSLFSAGNGTSITVSNFESGELFQTIVAFNGINASTSAKGVAQFSSDNFAASSGTITIKDGGVDLTAEVTGVLPSANLDADTAHLSTDQTFTGTKTFDETISGNISGSAATVTSAAQTNITSLGTLTSLDVDAINLNTRDITITGSTDDTFSIVTGVAGATTLTTHDEAGTAGHFEIAADGNITLDAAGDIALEAGGADVDITADHVTITSSSASDPTLKLKSTTNDANGCQIQLRNDKGAAGADGDGIGSIRFIGDDAAQTQTEFGKIICQVSEADNTDEAGKIRFMVASSDGTTTALTNGLIIEGEHATASEVDVTIANGSASTTTISGNLNVIGNVLPGITYIKILPSDFMPDDVGRPAMIDDTGSDRWLESHSTAKLFAYVDIPVGFKATHVDVYGSATSAVTVYEADVNSKTVTSKGTGNIGTQINITDVSSDATNYILIELAQASGEEVYGGNLTIAKI